MRTGHRPAWRSPQSRAARIAVPLAIPMALGLVLGVVLAFTGGPSASTIKQSAAAASASPSAAASTPTVATAGASPSAVATVGVLAYRNAAKAVRDAPVSVTALAREGRATELPGIGGIIQEKVLALADDVGVTLIDADEARARANFATSARYEWMFWDAAWRRETWPV